MKIGIATDNPSLESIVSNKFADCKYLLIVNINDYSPKDVIGIFSY